ncbi:kielin/chordin-like protein isoform X2 [Aotus nancymaae]|uniref:kielin/chordin-like protein isoform X2 n=1 Tax=Aotus nancymaae TaxID=37293 RepID=UPI0030FE2B14
MDGGLSGQQEEEIEFLSNANTVRKSPNMTDRWILSFMRSLIGFFETEMAGPFSQCHQVVPPQSIFASCVQGQCGTKGDTTALCHSLQAYASLCAQAGQAPAWRNRTFCLVANLGGRGRRIT